MKDENKKGKSKGYIDKFKSIIENESLGSSLKFEWTFYARNSRINKAIHESQSISKKCIADQTQVDSLLKEIQRKSKLGLPYLAESNKILKMLR